MTILIVDDNVPQGESLELLLRTAGHVAYSARNGEAAKVVAETHPPDAVILDWIMPGGGGGPFLTWLRSRPETVTVPVVVTTGLPADSLPELTGLERVAVLQKPFNLDELLAVLRGLGAGASTTAERGPV